MELLRELRAALEASKRECAQLRDELQWCKVRASTAESMFESEHQLTERLWKLNTSLRQDLEAAESRRIDLVMSHVYEERARLQPESAALSRRPR